MPTLLPTWKYQISSCERAAALGNDRQTWFAVDRRDRAQRGSPSPSDSKTGAKTVPLGDPAVDLLRSIPAVDRSAFVFPAPRGSGHILGLRLGWEKVRKLADVRGLRIHDLRHSFASVAVTGGESLYVVGKIVGHRQARTTNVCVHLAPDPVQAAADRAARKIFDALRPTA